MFDEDNSTKGLSLTEQCRIKVWVKSYIGSKREQRTSFPSELETGSESPMDQRN